MQREFNTKISTVSFISLILCFVLVGCAPAIGVKKVTDVPADEALVFGEIVAMNLKSNTGYSVFILDEGSRKEATWEMSEDTVYWHLPPGKYVITSFQLMNGFGRIWVKFEVPSGHKAVYIGTLKVAVGVISTVTIEDNMEFALAALNKKFSSPPMTVTKSLMKKEGP